MPRTDTRQQQQPEDTFFTHKNTLGIQHAKAAHSSLHNTFKQYLILRTETQEHNVHRLSTYGRELLQQKIEINL